MTFSHPDYTVGLRISLNRRPLPAPVFNKRADQTWGFNLGTSARSRAWLPPQPHRRSGITADPFESAVHPAPKV